MAAWRRPRASLVRVSGSPLVPVAGLARSTIRPGWFHYQAWLVQWQAQLVPLSGPAGPVAGSIHLPGRPLAGFRRTRI